MFQKSESIKISDITIYNYIKNNPNINKEELIESYYEIYGLVGVNSEKEKETIRIQIESNLRELKKKELIIEDNRGILHFLD